jgi:hypothetical protein
MNESKTLSAQELDEMFDAGEDISAHLDWSMARRPGREQLARILRETKQRLLEEIQRLDRAIEEIEAAKH